MLESLGVWSEFLKASPAPIHAVKIHFGDWEKSWRLPQPAFGLSRYRLDKLLLDCAISRGAELVQEQRVADGLGHHEAGNDEEQVGKEKNAAFEFAGAEVEKSLNGTQHQEPGGGCRAGGV